LVTASFELPRLHVITNDAVLGEPDFADRAQGLLARFGSRIALHLRSRALSGGPLFALAQTLSALEAAVIVINDRVDVALTTRAAGVQLRRDSLPITAARELLGETRLVGYSAHERLEAAAAQVAGADFIVAGTIFESGSHPDAPARGLDFLSGVAQAVSVPVLAIGGVTAERVRECRAAGAFGVAVIGAVWSAADPLEAANLLLSELEN
jgi:thiamine-phosphate diphosphorylase